MVSNKHTLPPKLNTDPQTVAWDVVGQATFGKPLGYLEHGCDFDGTLDISRQAMNYLVTVGMQHKLDSLLDKNPVYRIGPPSLANITAVAMTHLANRYTGADNHDPSNPDFLDRYLEAKKAHPEEVDDPRILGYLLVNLAAGADTTACSLKSFFYLTLKHPAVWARLEADILAAPFASGETMDLPAPYSQTRAIPYLEAVVRECLRLYPGNCFPQERYVPAGGLTLPDGSFVPEGTAVGFNAYVLHRNKQVWGEDAEEFRPERWLRDAAGGESEEAFKTRMTHMNNSDLSFGAGVRKCIGMNLGMMEVYKAVTTLIASFEFQLADQEAEWTIHNNLFPTQSGVIMQMRRRAGVELRDE
ncbi:cytochrome P450 [Candidatus Bathyarchaeota archaeon]|nr:cytochrome P450 [Candidatus Bathyarchaeota archaeon]